MSVSRHSDSTPDSRRVPPCFQDYRASRAVQAALLVTTAEVVGTEGTLCCSSVDTRGRANSVCTLIPFLCAPSLFRVFLGASVVLPSRILFSLTLLEPQSRFGGKPL